MTGRPAQPLTDSYFVVRALRALDLAALGARSTREFADGLQIHPRTARRMLARLCDEGFLVLTDGQRGRYELTMRLVALGARASTSARLPRLAGPMMERLHATLGLPVGLAVPCYDSVLVVAQHGQTGVGPPVGTLAPCHCTAAGKVLLAGRPAWRATVLAASLERFTERTQTDARVLRRELADIQARGFATEAREHSDDLCAIAAPVHWRDERAVAALVATSHQALDLPTAARPVIEAAADITRALDS